MSVIKYQKQTKIVMKENLRRLLSLWRNDSEDIWFVVDDQNVLDTWKTFQGEQQMIISILEILIEKAFANKNPEIITLIVGEWEDERELKDLISGEDSKEIANLVEQGNPDEFFIIGAAIDRDSRGPYIVYLAAGGDEWAKKEWTRLGVTNHRWESVSEFGLFGNQGDEEDELALAESRIEKLEENESIWSDDGIMGWALKITFKASFKDCLNWKDWPETLL
jgi:hypothetical protein